MKIDIKDVKKGDILVISCYSNLKILEALEDSKVIKGRRRVFNYDTNTINYNADKYKYLKCKIRYKVHEKFSPRNYVFPNQNFDNVVEETVFIDLNNKEILKYEL